MRLALTQILLSFFLASSLSAHASDDACAAKVLPKRPLTLNYLRDLSAARIKLAERTVPRPGFDVIEDEASREQVGVTGPRALQEMLPAGTSFVSTPAPTSNDIAAVNLTEEFRSFPVHVDMQWAGKTVSTAVYASLPKPKIMNSGPYLIGREYPVALVFLHGGGTPTATGKNAMTLAEKMIAAGIPVLAPDMPGHGRATRKLEGFESFKQQIDWLWEIVERLVDPNVKIVIGGHSWGGEFAVYMHRLSADPKYARVMKYIALAPPVDTSKGGDLQAKLEHERWFEKNWRSLADRIAPSDFEFRDNLLQAGKVNFSGSYHTNVTHLDYVTPPLSVDEQKQLKPLIVLTGDADGMVYVGNEEYFQLIFGDLQAPNEYHVLGSGTTWKSKNAQDLHPTGHNIWDRYIDGTTTLQVYNMLMNWVLAEAGGQPISNDHNVDKAGQIVDEFFRQYANFFAFRELVNMHVEFVRVETPHLQTMASRKRELDEYLKRVGIRRGLANKEVEEKIKAALDALRAEVGLTEPLSLGRAEEELALKPLTEARRQELENYVAEVNKMESELKNSFTDPEFDADVADIAREFAGVLQELGVAKLEGVEDYKPHMDRLQSSRNLDKAQQRQRSELSKLHQKFTEAEKTKRQRFGVERERRLAKLVQPEGIVDQRSAMRELRADRSEQRRAMLTALVARYAEVENKARAEALAQVEADVAQIPRPAGLTSPEHAEAQKATQDAMMNFTFQPAGDEDLSGLGRRIGERIERLERVIHGDAQSVPMEKLESNMWDLRLKRLNLINKKWLGLWSKDILTSPRYREAKASYDRSLASYYELYHLYEERKGDWMLELKRTGQMTGGRLQAGTPELNRLRTSVLKAKHAFMQMAQELDHIRWSEAILGKLEGPEGMVKEAQTVATQVWGEDFARTRKAGPGSLTAQLKNAEDHLEGRRRQESLLVRELDELKSKYSGRMLERGHQLPYVIERVEIGQVLDQPLDQLLAQLRTNRVLAEALQKTLSRWETFHGELRRETQMRPKED